MSENCWIGKIDENGRGLEIYCHDGRPWTTGKRLLEHYVGPRKIDQMLALGWLSSLGSTLDRMNGATVRGMDGIDEPITRAYCRDRADSWPGHAPRPFSDGALGFFQRRGASASFAYLWTPQTGWLGGSGTDGRPLAELIAWHEPWADQWGRAPMELMTVEGELCEHGTEALMTMPHWQGYPASHQARTVICRKCHRRLVVRDQTESPEPATPVPQPASIRADGV